MDACVEAVKRAGEWGEPTSRSAYAHGRAVGDLIVQVKLMVGDCTAWAVLLKGFAGCRRLVSRFFTLLCQIWPPIRRLLRLPARGWVEWIDRPPGPARRERAGVGNGFLLEAACARHALGRAGPPAATSLQPGLVRALPWILALHTLEQWP